MTGNLLYRPEIDGLRAIAVGAVLLFHLDPRLAPGGFVGVDIFFVISGFLITSIIAKSAGDGGFSFGDFYLRRIRRIAPAYFVVVVATLAAGCVLMLPADRAQLARSASWSALASANLFFWLNIDTGYFADDSRQLPLLHLWSLGVEEQFYLLWPALLIAWRRLLPLRWLLPAIAVLCVASFALAQREAALAPAFAYYMLPPRAGELGVGALLALTPVREVRRDGGLVHEFVAIAGLLLMLWAICMLDDSSHFPGWNALLPCLGAALVIAADSRRRCVVLAPLRWKPVVGMGLISYSLYLWHWPILAFMRYVGIHLDAPKTVAVVAAIFASALASYFFVERAIRSMRWSVAWQVAALFVGPSLVVVAGSAFLASHPDRVAGLLGKKALDRSEQALLAQTAPAYEFPYNCQLSSFDPGVLDRAACVHGSSTGNSADILLWGDSHAAHYIGVLATIAEKNGLRLRNASLSTCPPVWSDGNDYGMSIYRDGCTHFRALIHENAGRFPIMAIGAQWSAYLADPRFAADFERTLQEMSEQGKAIVLLAEVPSFPAYDRHCEIRNLRHALVDCKATSTRDDTGQTEANAYLRSLAARYPNVFVLDIHDLICRRGVCSPYLGDRQIYYDTSHLSMEGSWLLGRRLFESAVQLPPPLRAK